MKFIALGMVIGSVIGGVIIGILLLMDAVDRRTT